MGPSPCFLSPSLQDTEGKVKPTQQTPQSHCLTGGGRTTGLSHHPVPSRVEVGEEPNAAFH